jgi:hypothetical protein
LWNSAGREDEGGGRREEEGRSRGDLGRSEILICYLTAEQCTVGVAT